MGASEDDERQFAERIRQQRQVRKWSQAELARRMGDVGAQVQSTTIAKIEAGTRAVRLGEAAAMAKVLEMSLDDLLLKRRDQAAVIDQFVRDCDVALRELSFVTDLVYDAQERLRVQPSDMSERTDIAYGEPITEASIKAADHALRGAAGLVEAKQELRDAIAVAEGFGTGVWGDGARGESDG